MAKARVGPQVEEAAIGDTLRAIRAADDAVRALLGHASATKTDDGTPPGDFGRLLDVVRHANENLARSPLPPGADEDLRAEVRAYCERLQQLKTLLEELRPRLEARRDALVSAIARLRAKRKWVASLQQTRYL